MVGIAVGTLGTEVGLTVGMVVGIFGAEVGLTVGIAVGTVVGLDIGAVV